MNLWISGCLGKDWDFVLSEALGGLNKGTLLYDLYLKKISHCRQETIEERYVKASDQLRG